MTTTPQGPLYAVTALFETPDAILRAAAAARAAGYTKFDVNTPYPVHGMDAAMGLRPTRLGVFALVFGLLGALSAVGFMTWVTLVDYPLVIGGKPFWSWPAFVPVAFEVTVLLASVLTVLTMIVLYFKFPNTSHPLLDTPYMKRVSSDRFGLVLLAADPMFDERKAREFLASLGPGDVAAVHYDPVDRAHAPALFEVRFMALLAGIALVSAGATYLMLNVVLYLPPFDWMMNQEKLKPQKPSALFADGKGMRTPVTGTVARGLLPYAYAGQPDSAGKYLANPLPATAAVVERGRQKYLTFCSPCHGNFGRGDSRLAGQFPNPPTLHSDKARQWPDGNIYHVITEGQNVMPSYASQIPRDDRWAIVHYVRVLQRAHNAREADLR
jgi:mono/diheme cytochrome c family protein